MRRSALNLSTTLLLVVALLAACGGNPTATSALSAGPSAAAGTSAAPASATPTPAPSAVGAASPTRAASTSAAAAGPTRAASTPGNLTIFAASSLTDAFNELRAAIEAANPGTTITLNFASSSALRTQLEQGAKADLFASADTVQMDNARNAGLLVGDSAVFARNAPVIIVPANNPKGITSPADLAKPGVKLVLAAPEVPIGNYARQVITKLATDAAMGADYEAKVLANLVSNEANVRAVVAKVQLGEGDAGIVYSSDVTPAVAAHLKAVNIPEGLNAIAEYPVAVVKGTMNEAGARAFIDYLLSVAGQAILRKWGFLPVPPKRLAAWPARSRPGVGAFALAQGEPHGRD